MAFNPYYQNPYYPQPMPDNLMQMRQQQMMQPTPPPVPQNPVLWDSTAPTVYLKQSDASGKPTLKIYDLVERAETPRTAPQEKGVEFVTRKEFDALAALVGELKGKKKRKVEEDEDDD